MLLKTRWGMGDGHGDPENGLHYRRGLLPWQGCKIGSSRLRGLPVAVGLLDRQLGHRPALAAERLFHDPEAGLEPAGRAAQRVLGIEAHLAGHVDDGEEEVAELPLPLLRRLRRA